MKKNRFILVAIAVLLLAISFGAWRWMRAYRIAHTPVLVPLRPLEVPDLSGATVPLPFCDLTLTQVSQARSTGHENVRSSKIEFVDGTAVGINSALGQGPGSARFIFQEKYRDQFVSSEGVTAYYNGLASGRFSTPWRFKALPPDAQHVRRITPFVAQAGAGLMVESDPDGADAFFWDPTKTRVATLTCPQGGASHLWEILESWRWQDRPNFPVEPPEGIKIEAVAPTP